MVNLLLRVILTIVTILLDIIIMGICLIIGLLLWEDKWVLNDYLFIFTGLLWEDYK